MMGTTLVPLAGHHTGPCVSSMDWKTMTEKTCEQIQNPSLLIGSSLGGKIIVDAVQRGMFPSDVPVVLLDIAPIAYRDAGTRGIAEFMINHTAQTHEDVCRAARKQYSDEITDIVMTNYDGTNWTCQADLIRDNAKTLSRLPRQNMFIDNPTLLLKGEHSPYIPPKYRPSQNFRNAQMDTVPYAGHWVYLNSPLYCQDVIKKFVQQI